MNTTRADAAQGVRDSQTAETSILSPHRFFLFLFVYFALQTIIRTFVSGTIDLDESEQLILTQKFAWGYGSQPPLYTWLQMLFFKTFGVSVFALALMKNLLLFSIYAFTYLNVRFVTRSEICGVLGAVSLLFIPQVAWESQRDLTHSILASALVAATLFVFFRMSKNSVARYASFGLCVALGILSKYNYAAFLFGLVVAAFTLRQFRGVLLNGRIFISVLVCLGILFPHLLWAFVNEDSLTSTTYKFHQENSNLLAVAAAGCLRLFVAVVFHLAPLLFVFALLFGKNLFLTGNAKQNTVARFFLRQYGIILAGLVLAILLFRVTGFKDRWFEPIFISVPVLLFAVVKDFLRRKNAKTLLILGVAVAVAVLLLIPGRILLAETMKTPQLLNAPFAALRPELDAAIPDGAVVIAESKWVGGNVRLQLPRCAVVTPELARFFPATNGVRVIVWDATKKDQPKSVFQKFLNSTCDIDFGKTEATFISAKCQYFRERNFRLGIAVARE